MGSHYFVLEERRDTDRVIYCSALLKAMQGLQQPKFKGHYVRVEGH